MLSGVTSDRPRRRKNGIDTANVGIRDNPKATKTAEGPMRVFLFSLDEDDDDDAARETVKAGSDSEMTAPASLVARAGGLGSKVVTSGRELRFKVPLTKDFPMNVNKDISLE